MMGGMTRFYVIRVSPEGRADPECGAAGPFPASEAIRRAHREPDPSSGWRDLIVMECDAAEPGGWRDKIAAAVLSDPRTAERAKALLDGEWTGFAGVG